MPCPNPYIYEPLPAKSIRVLELREGVGNQPLIYELIIQAITGNSYEAISYAWGDSKRTGLILCNGKNIGITTSLISALSAFRLIHGVRRVWADAVCINQEDVEERNSQVAQMDAIYTSAERVLGWLGHDPGFAKIAIGHIQSFNRSPETCIDSAKRLQVLDIAKDESVNFNPEWQAWKAIKEYFEVPFFHRVWIIQELGLGKTAVLYCDSYHIEWLEVANFVFLMDNMASFLVVHLQLKSWIVNHTKLIWNISTNGQPRYDILDVVNWARVHQATNPKDRIYGLLGHPSANVGDRVFIEPDYDLSVAQVYVQFAVEVIKSTRGLRILSAVEHDAAPASESLPTWVPNWNTETKCTMLATVAPAAPAREQSEEFPRILDNNILSVRGFKIDTVLAFSEIIDQNQLVVTTLEIEMQKKIPFLVDHIWKILATSSSITVPTQETLDNLSLSFHESFPIQRIPSSQSFIRHRADFAAYLFEFEKILPNRNGSILASMPLPMRYNYENQAREGSATEFIQKMTWTCMARRVFVTSNGHIGIGHRIMQKGDICCVIVGSVIPMMLRSNGHSSETFLVGECILHPFMGYKSFLLYREGQLRLQEFHIK